jgi:oxaloacetate decarboxylase alpha subunit
MKEINFVDTTLRDGHQSLWATRMKTAHMMPITSTLDDAGFYAIDLMGTVHFDACLRYLRENPWERIRLLAKAMPKTPLSGLMKAFYTPWLATGSQWLGFQRGAASLWSRAG